MKMRYVIAVLAATFATQASAYTCQFTTECYENAACEVADFNIDVMIEDKEIVTEFGELTLVAVKETGRLTTIFATGDGAEYLLSLSAKAARFTSHANDGPQSITYLGTCAGAF